MRVLSCLARECRVAQTPLLGVCAFRNGGIDARECHRLTLRCAACSLSLAIALVSACVSLLDILCAISLFSIAVGIKKNEIVVISCLSFWQPAWPEKYLFLHSMGTCQPATTG